MNLNTFHFRDLHPGVRIGTASDRYADATIKKNLRISGQLIDLEKLSDRVCKKKNVSSRTPPLSSFFFY